MIIQKTFLIYSIYFYYMFALFEIMLSKCGPIICLRKFSLGRWFLDEILPMQHFLHHRENLKENDKAVASILHNFLTSKEESFRILAKFTKIVRMTIIICHGKVDGTLLNPFANTKDLRQEDCLSFLN